MKINEYFKKNEIIDAKVNRKFNQGISRQRRLREHSILASLRGGLWWQAEEGVKRLHGGSQWRLLEPLTAQCCGSYVVVYGCVWLCVVVCSRMWLYVVVCSCLLSCVVVCGCM